jgi:tetratricopeptide (TPR) repeat protein
MKRPPTLGESKAKLASFFMDVFTTTELRIFVSAGLHGKDVTVALPGPEASLQTLAHEVVDTLVRMNLVESGLFARLRIARPRFLVDIDSIEQDFLAVTVRTPGQLPQAWVHATTDDVHYSGRATDLRTLDRWAAEPTVRVIALTGFGGMGKTSLVGHWLKQIGTRKMPRELCGLFAWSYYSDRSTESLLANLLSFARSIGITNLGGETEDDPGAANDDENNGADGGKPADGGTDEQKKARTKASHELLERAKKLIANHPILVLLDGLEVIQEGRSLSSAQEYGLFLDHRLREFLLSICRFGRDRGGLVILTSRFPFADLQKFLGREFRLLDLERLSPDDGAEVLLACGVKGTPDECRGISALFEGHPLALRIFAKVTNPTNSSPLLFARTILADTGASNEFNNLQSDSKIRRLLAFYSESISQIQRVILASIALFFEAVEDTMVVRLVSMMMSHLDQRSICDQIELLVLDGFVIREIDLHLNVRYSCHPILKDYFRRSITENKNQVESLARTLVPDAPVRLDDETYAEPNLTTDRPAQLSLGANERVLVLAAIDLFISIEDYRRADDLFDIRLGNGLVFLETLELHQGLECILRFVGTPSRQAACEMKLSPRRVAYYLHLAGLLALAAGEVEQAQQLCQQSYDASMRVGKTLYRIFLPNLARPRVLVGQLQEAEAWLQGVLDWAIPLQMECESLSALTTLADALGLMGRLKDASTTFRDAFKARISLGRKPRHVDVDDPMSEIALLFDSSLLVKWAILMLRTGNHEIVESTLTGAIGCWDSDPDSYPRLARPDERARIHWLLGWCALRGGKTEAALEQLTSAETTFRSSLWLEDLAAVLLAKTQVRFVEGDWASAADTIEEVLEICAPRHMKLLHADALCARARLQIHKHTNYPPRDCVNALEAACDDAKSAIRLAAVCKYAWAKLDALSVMAQASEMLGIRADASRYRSEHQHAVRAMGDFEATNNDIIQDYLYNIYYAQA